jgi:sugar (pentulose or hexulose) kinase
MLGAGTGDNAAAALGVGADRADIVVSIGTSGVVSAVSATPIADASGVVAGFADATGAFLPLVCTFNAARVLDATARMLGVSLDELSRLALSTAPGADGLVLVPYLDGERTPNRPDATGALHGLTGRNTTPAHLARAAVEGLLCGLADGLADGLDALRSQGVEVSRALLVGGEHGRKQCGGSPRACWGSPSWSRSRASTSPTALPGRRPGHWPGAPLPRSGAAAATNATTPTRCRGYEGATPRSAN